MSRQLAIDLVTTSFDDGYFQQTMEQRIALHTESQRPESLPILYQYLKELIVPKLEGMGFTWKIIDNSIPGCSPFLLAERIEEEAAGTLLTYGHGDVVNGYDNQWKEGLSPWKLTIDGDVWYGRGTADNKGQHTINLLALEAVLKAREGRLGYNIKILLEMGEEAGSQGLHAFCREYAQALSADLLIASDGPRLSAASPTMFLGSRGAVNFDFRINSRPGGHHSGNWGGVLSNPGIRMAHAIASLVTDKGQVLAKKLLPESLPDSVRQALKTIEVGTDPTAPPIDLAWGEPGLSPAEQLFGWNTFEVIAFKTGNPDNPVNAIPGNAYAMCQIRYVVGTDNRNFVKHIREHLDAHGFSDVEVKQNGEEAIATRLDPDSPWVKWGLDSMQRTTGKIPSLLPNLGGSLPNDAFAEILELPTVWIPHSYPACSQHAANEHLLGSVAREALQLMAGVLWDLGDDFERLKTH